MKSVFQNKHLLAFLLMLLFLWSSFASAHNGRAQSPFQVGLVVQVNGQTITRCVTLSEDKPTGYDVLKDSGLDLITSIGGMGVAVCSIDGVGCPANDCFCQSYSAPYYYWSYWHLQNDTWTYSSLGASNYFVAAQSVEGWIWGDGKTPPPVLNFASICNPTPSQTPSYTPSKAPSSTPAPIYTPSKAPTETPSLKKTSTASSTSLPTLTSVNVNSSATSTPTATTPPPLITTPTPHIFAATPSLTPSPTITLAYAIQALASSTSLSSGTTPISPSPTKGVNFDAISLTATAVELTRHPAPPSSSAMDTLSHLIKIGFVAFLGMLGGVLILLIGVLLRKPK